MSHPTCPICKESIVLATKDPKLVLQAFPNFPFCSERCKMIDLGHWFDGNYGFSRALDDNSELSE